MMTLDQARKTLIEGGSLVDLMEAAGVAASDPHSSVSDLLLGLAHPECVAEQAAFALHRRTGRPFPAVGSAISRDPEDWIVWLLENTKPESAERLRVLLAACAATAARVNPEVAAKLAPAIDQAAR